MCYHPHTIALRDPRCSFRDISNKIVQQRDKQLMGIADLFTYLICVSR